MGGHLARFRRADLRYRTQPHKVSATVDLRAIGPASTAWAYAQEEAAAVVQPLLLGRVSAQLDPP